MQKYIFFITFILLFSSCKKETIKEENKKDSIVIEQSQKETVSIPEITGLWIGKFDPTEAEIKAKRDFEKRYDDESFNENNIPENLKPYTYIDPLYGSASMKAPNTLSIEINALHRDGTFSGTTVCAGNELVLEGSYSLMKNNSYHFTGKEIGDNPNKGSLKFDITSGVIIGNWSPEDSPSTIKSFGLNKAHFNYSENTGQNEINLDKNPSKTLLSSSDVENITKPQLRILRNTIFARHGMSFKSIDLRNYFEEKPWYIPRKSDVTSELNPIERKNIVLINRYESYAQDTFDDFGR